MVWALKVVQNDLPFAVCDDIGKLFNSMFPGSASNDFQCGSAKMSYLITHGVAPYFKELLLNDIRKSSNGYTLHSDKTTTSQTEKQMDVIVRYWLLEYNQIVVQYLDSLFFGHALSTTVAEKLLSFISDKKLSLSKLFSISSDGPNVNKAILQKLKNSQMQKCHF